MKRPKEQALQFLQFIEEGGRLALEFDGLRDGDRKNIEEALRRVRPAFDELAKWFIEPLSESKPAMADFGYEKLWALMGLVWILGAKADVAESAAHAPHVKEEVLGEKQSENARKPRLTRYSAERAELFSILHKKPDVSAAEADEELKRKGISAYEEGKIGNDLLKAQHAFAERLSSLKKLRNKISE